MSHGMPAFWTEYREALLRELWRDGKSCSQIAVELGNGCTRSMIAGKARRLDLPSRVKVQRAKRRIA